MKNRYKSMKKRNDKHILVVSQYFYPESFRINDMVKEWVKRGYKVTVLTGIPNYPEGKFYAGYGYRKRRHEKWNGAQIIRLPLIARGGGFISLFANYMSFAIAGILWSSWNDIGADLVFTFEVSPMTQALAGVRYADKHHVPHYIYVTDLWPQNVEFITGIHHKIVTLPIQMMADYIYKHSTRILTCSKSFIKPIHERGVSMKKIEFWPQYAEDFYRPVDKDEGYGIPQDGTFNIVSAGNIGLAQGLGILAATAKLLESDHRKVRFSIIGDGRYLPELKQKIRESETENYFHFIPRQPPEAVASYHALADALLITLSKSEVFANTIPSKTQSCLACGKPVLVSADGEVQDIIREAQAGLASNAEDADGLAENIKVMMGLTEEERRKMAENALRYADSRFNKNHLLSRLDQIFKGE